MTNLPRTAVLLFAFCLAGRAFAGDLKRTRDSLELYGKAEVVIGDPLNPVAVFPAKLSPTGKMDELRVDFAVDEKPLTFHLDGTHLHLNAIRKAGVNQEVAVAKGIFAPAAFNRRIRIPLIQIDAEPTIFVEMMVLTYSGSDRGATFRPRWVALRNVAPTNLSLEDADFNRFALAQPGNGLIPITILERRQGLVYFVTSRSLRSAGDGIQILAADEQLVRRIDTTDRYSRLPDWELDAILREDPLHGPDGVAHVRWHPRLGNLLPFLKSQVSRYFKRCSARLAAAG